MFEFKSAAVISVFEHAGLSQEIFEDTGLVGKLAQATYNAASNLDCTDKFLAEAALQVANVARRVTEAVEQGMSLNALGELQSRGPDLDRLCAVRDQQASALKSLLFAYKAIVGIEA